MQKLLLESGLRELGETLDALDRHAKSLTGQQRAIAAGRIRDYKERLRVLGADLRRAREGGDRDGLLEGGVPLGASMEGREKMTNVTSTAERGRERLRETNRTLISTIETGQTALLTLDDQKSQMIRVRDNLDETDSVLGRAGKVLKTMARRAIANRVLMIGIILVLLTTIFLIVYFRWLKPKGSPEPDPAHPTSSVTPKPTATPKPSSAPKNATMW